MTAAGRANVAPQAIPAVDSAQVAQDVARALAEDIGSGDVTAMLLPEAARLEASVLCREPAVIAGQPWFDAVFEAVDPSITLNWQVAEGATVAADTVVCTLAGPARTLLTAERTALNFLQTLSGTATTTARYVAALGPGRTRLLDTRKTLPGLRHAQKYAVACGGGCNHRIGLFDAVLIKENHIAAAGSLSAALAAAQARADAGGVPLKFIEVEVESLAELDEALAAGATRVMLDNFDNDAIREAVARTDGRAELEVSGNVALERLPELAATGVDYVSVGALTKHVTAVDFSLRYR